MEGKDFSYVCCERMHTQYTFGSIAAHHLFLTSRMSAHSAHSAHKMFVFFLLLLFCVRQMNLSREKKTKYAMQRMKNINGHRCVKTGSHTHNQTGNKKTRTNCGDRKMCIRIESNRVKSSRGEEEEEDEEMEENVFSAFRFWHKNTRFCGRKFEIKIYSQMGWDLGMRQKLHLYRLPNFISIYPLSNPTIYHQPQVSYIIIIYSLPLPYGNDWHDMGCVSCRDRVCKPIYQWIAFWFN